ncbi:MAG: agmatinase family protein [Cyanobacteria bacterium J06632_22]
MPTKAEILASFDPSEAGLNNGQLFGFPFDYNSADIIILGIPWEVTVSYGAGTASGPAAVLGASPQLDFYDLDNPQGWQQGIFMEPIPAVLAQHNHQLRQKAAQVITGIEQGKGEDPELLALLDHVNQGCEVMTSWVRDRTLHALSQNKKVGLIGGDHSVPLGYFQALGQHYPAFGILHIDAHADLRNAYEGFTQSHASIMFNALKIPQLTKLVQVGIRDVSLPEVQIAEQSNGRVKIHFDAHLQQDIFMGTPWHTLCRQIVADLPPQVYISFDVDGLDPKLCPHTGTPVPGGFELEEAYCLLREVVRSGREIIGFDLCEVGDGEWDGNVGARIVFKLCNLMGLTTRRQP